jgi:hypothetical protein
MPMSVRNAPELNTRGPLKMTTIGRLPTTTGTTSPGMSCQAGATDVIPGFGFDVISA